MLVTSAKSAHSNKRKLLENSIEERRIKDGKYSVGKGGQSIFAETVCVWVGAGFADFGDEFCDDILCEDADFSFRMSTCKIESVGRGLMGFGTLLATG